MYRLNIKYLDHYTLDKKITFPRFGDVGIDMFSLEDCSLKEGEVKLLSTGIAMELPSGFWLSLRDRSSCSKYFSVLAGVIDNNYRGEIKVRVLPHTDYLISRGDKIVQGIICKDFNFTFSLQEVDVLSETLRDKEGFGSTGK